MTFKAIAGMTVLACASPTALAQPVETYPARPLRMIVAFTAGSETDFFARIVGQKMAERWNQQVVVDNRPGAGGVLATKLVASSSPDGYTIFMNSMAHAITPAIYTKLPYDTLRDLTGIAQVSGVPNVLIVPPAQGVKSVRELIALARQSPGQ
ncbi:MAG TPA: tripartite tricarboxylate transporter substrate-binding protein, partial [Burkholderiales bacterium]|nr:tripartite tricarboxylate transporter substrate-binding protein [Burkholderiales bacterium]